ncbi:transcription-repair coupling factor [Dethiobacter alkaliphilus]|uniref:transcription-repair coupling factor n=1 Tax=Dethiobacter alkaliphilus TaxID=427926 RepID=UPI002227E3F8|nr:transcription-repair coupling factor [Dethiobacter alkaliphilus]MCW3489128.1 transcription-repair coupling factor [Dethiobacter alkaliphilus]
MLREVAAELLALPSLQPLLEGLKVKSRYQLVYGLDESARTMLMAALRLHTDRPVLIVTPDQTHAGRIYEDMLSVFKDEDVYLFPGKELLYYSNLFSESGDAAAQRIAAMKRLARGDNIVVVATVSAMVTKMPPFAPWKEACFTLRPDDDIPINELLGKLVDAGYERVEMVDVQGQISVRGGIVDIYPAGEPYPYRIEFFGETVDSIRRFDPESQRSRERVDLLELTPARELVVTAAERKNALSALAKEEARLSEQLAKGVRTEAEGKLQERLAEHMEKIREEVYFPGMEQYLLYFYDQAAKITDYFPDNTLLFIDEPHRCENTAEQLVREIGEMQSTLFAQGDLPARSADMVWSYKSLMANLPTQLVAFSLFAHSSDHHPYRRSVSLSAKPVPKFLGQWDLFGEEVGQWRRQGYRVVILTSSRQRSTGIVEVLAEKNIPAHYTLSEPDLAQRSVTLLHGSLESGFVLPEIKLVLLTEQDILPQKKKRRRIKGKEGVRVGDYQELQVGDFVVHEQHGIGQYLGLRTLDVGGTQRDYLYIQYSGNDKLYIPIEQIDVVRKYIGVEGKKPKMSALGGGEWSRVKARVQASVQELAKDLLALYAARETEQGHAFSPDHSWQKDFEAAFPYEETPDQLQAIAEVKQDMEKSTVTDRLLCGDVGYGKTEVALRGAFKAVMDGKQAAFLVPTTVLAQQHYHNFVERLEGFPVNVGILSRFQSPAEQKETIKGLKEGTIDLVVGTHRILSKDIRFRDLGFLVVDEEQRFGVRHKERIKMLKKNLDVLTMTATPIPRTLHMSLVGVRDMSVIETPPEDRYPIQTYVLEYSDALIREAVMRELNRGGQVYFVHNRVQSINRWAAKLQELMPEVRLAVAHGQMPEDRLEKVMMGFLEGEYDVLLSTTIVEAGLDIPNVNTIIIQDADKFGLAQLYQLRGRVGRSNRIAYAYLTYQKDKVLTEVAEKRLQAIKEFTELGSGFKIAMRDLEIRGAGNILGPEQHGFMMAVGFDLYVKLLEDAIRTYKGQEEEARQEPRIEIQADAYLPASYISDARQKIVFYQKVAAVESVEQVLEAKEELCDRYGPLPAAAENLLNVAHVKLLARELYVSSVSEEKGEIQIRFAKDSTLSGDLLLKLSKQFKGRLTAGTGKQFILAFRLNTRSAGERLLFILELFDELKKLAIKDNIHL